nr:MAG TPA: hypothetical protein [Caudoviricetes sp.]
MFTLIEKIMMYFDRKYFCKKELQNGKCEEIKKKCCMYKHICKL